MTLKQASNLPDGTYVIWPEVQGQFTKCRGIVHRPADCIPAFILWEDGQETALYDEAALAYVEIE